MLVVGPQGGRSKASFGGLIQAEAKTIKTDKTIASNCLLIMTGSWIIRCRLPPAFSGAANGIGGTIRNWLRGLRCNALLDPPCHVACRESSRLLSRPQRYSLTLTSLH